MESNASSRDSVVSKSRPIPSSIARGGRRRKSRRKGNPMMLPTDVLKHVGSFLHPANTVALRQTSRSFRDAVNRHPSKRNALRSIHVRSMGYYPAAQNRFIMNTSRRHYMKQDQARKYLEKMFTHRGNGNLFRKGISARPLIFPGMLHARPTDQQRLALARAITGDKSKQGTDFMYKLIKRIKSRRGTGTMRAVTALSPRSLASMYSTHGPGRIRVL